jgi:predicted amidohydrolase
MAQMNPVVGDFAGNTERIVRAAVHARTAGADLTAFPELSLCGCPTRNLTDLPAFLSAQDQALERLKKALSGLPAFVGFIDQRRGNDPKNGAERLNAYGLIRDGKLAFVAHKCMPAADGVSPELHRLYFGDKPAVFSFRNRRIGIALGEDVWGDLNFGPRKNEEFNPLEKIIAAGADLLLNPSAIPFRRGRQNSREALLSSLARKHRLPIFHINLVGGNEELIFDGCSLALDARGKLLARGPAFAESVVTAELSTGSPTESTRLTDMEEIRRALSMGLRDFTLKKGFDGVVVGLTEELNSIVTLVIAAEAFEPKKILCVLAVGRNYSFRQRRDLEQLAANLGVRFESIPFDRSLLCFQDALSGILSARGANAAESDFSAHVRGTLLSALADSQNYALLTPDDKMDLAFGQTALQCRARGVVAPLGDLYRSHVVELAEHINATREKRPIPEKLLTAATTEEKTTNSGLSNVVNDILEARLDEGRSAKAIVALGYKPDLVLKVLRCVAAGEGRRRQAPTVLSLSPNSFGTPGSRMRGNFFDDEIG